MSRVPDKTKQIVDKVYNKSSSKFVVHNIIDSQYGLSPVSSGERMCSYGLNNNVVLKIDNEYYNCAINTMSTPCVDYLVIVKKPNIHLPILNIGDVITIYYDKIELNYR